MEERRLWSPSDKGLTFETLAFQIFLRGDSIFINSFDKIFMFKSKMDTH